jgi:hypothetical protein
MLYIFGFSLGVVNVGVWLTYLPATFEWFSSRKRSQGQVAEYPQPADSIGSKAFGIFGYSLHILIILPIAIIMSLSPFFTPLAGMKIARKVNGFVLLFYQQLDCLTASVAPPLRFVPC